MSMYTEIYVNVDFAENVSQDIISTIEAMCNGDSASEYLKDKPKRWSYLFNNGSYYTPYTSCANLTYDTVSRQYSLIGKGDIKNYNNEIEEFFEYIKPYVDNSTEFMGYYRYEETKEPTLVYVN